MSISIQRIPRDRGPPLPKSGGTPFVGSHRDMCDPLHLDAKRSGPLDQASRGRSEVLDAAGTQCSDDLGHVHVRDPTISPRFGPSTSSVHHDINPGQSSPESTTTSSSPILTPPKQSTTRPRPVHRNGNENIEKAMRQPETGPISQDQLVAEVKGIYAGLVMVETKCIEVDNTPSSGATVDSNSKLNNEQWQALIALHRTLLHEHHDFFLASQHPSASPALRRLASKYRMPARMWRHGIHSFLELLRHRLPSSLEHMLNFTYLAYNMMAHLYETVPDDTWIECLGDLGRYRMAIEDDDIRDREVWTKVSRNWYNKASKNSPTTGRLYHHLAILARPNALQQLYHYAKALTVPIPFSSTRDSIMSLFDPVLSNNLDNPARLAPIDSAFIRAHGMLFSSGKIESIDWLKTDSLNPSLSKSADEWLEKGYIYASQFLNSLLFDEGFEEASRPLPEDFSIRGLLYCQDDFPTDWFGYDTAFKLDFDPLVLVEPGLLPPSHHSGWNESISNLFWLLHNYRRYLTTKTLPSVSNYLARLASIRLATIHHYFDNFLHATNVVL